MDMDTALFYLGLQTYKAMQAEEALVQARQQVEVMEAHIKELEGNPKQKSRQTTKKKED